MFLKSFEWLAEAFRVSDRDIRHIAKREGERERNIRIKQRKKILLRTLEKQGNPSLSIS